MVLVRTDPDQGSLWSLEPSLVTVLDLLQIGILDYKSQFDIVDCPFGIVPSRFFYLETSCVIGFPRSSHFVLFTFPLCLTRVECLT